MMIYILLAAILAQGPAPAASAAEDTETQEITVTANRKGRCEVRLQDRNLSSRQLAANARIWAANNVPVRVVRPAGASTACLAKIAFKLGDYGVRLIHFVDR